MRSSARVSAGSGRRAGARPGGDRRPGAGWTLISARVPMVVALEGFESRLKASAPARKEFVLETRRATSRHRRDVQAELARVFSNGNGNH